MLLPPSAPPDLRIFDRATWPQITAGIAVNSQPHVNEKTAKMRLQIAIAGVRGTVCGTAGSGGGDVSSAIATVVADFMREYKNGRMTRSRWAAPTFAPLDESSRWQNAIAGTVQACAPRRDCGNVLLIRSRRLQRDRRAGVHKKAQHFDWQSAGFWRRPTLARPIAVLPSGLQRFTSVFGMGTGGAATLMSPDRAT